MSKKALSQGLQGERTKTSCPVFLCVAKTGLLLDNRIPIRQIPSLCDCDEHKRVERYAITCRKAESDNYLLKISGSSRFRQTHKEDNDTPVQSQSEREKTVAGNEGGSVRTTVGVELPWCQFAADRLATSHSISGCRGQIEMLSHSSQTQGGQKNRDVVYALPTLNTSLCLAAYIGRTHLPKSNWEVKHNGKNY